MLAAALAISTCFLPVIGWADNSQPEPEPNSFSEEVSEARTLMSEKKWPEAVVVLRSALRNSPGSASLELDLTRALIYSGRREEALTVLSQMLFRKHGRAERQLIQRTRVLSRVFLTNADFQIYQDGINLMLAAKYRAATEHFEKVLEQEPANIEVLTRMSQCLVMEGDYDSAVERLRLAKRLNPYEPEIRLWLGRTLYQRGEIREALVELKSAYQDLPSSETAAVWYAEALFGLGPHAAAIQVLEDDLRHYPNHVLGLIDLSQYLLENSSPRDPSVAWQARKDLQLATSRIPLYLNTAPATDSNSVDRLTANSKNFDPMGDLALDLRKPEPELRHDIAKLMAEAENRIEGALPEN